MSSYYVSHLIIQQNIVFRSIVYSKAFVLDEIIVKLCIFAFCLIQSKQWQSSSLFHVLFYLFELNSILKHNLLRPSDWMFRMECALNTIKPKKRHKFQKCCNIVSWTFFSSDKYDNVVSSYIGLPLISQKFKVMDSENIRFRIT